ncbi:DsbA family protein [Paenibacillus sp. FSL R10-2782]|uniref:Dithiol-disulfide isomerase n=1 Tax=Paenibacillus terrae TaxID=159743 RepID=A0A4V5SQ85_9BACL|nr:DsbA family protein [Paenibacillus terrae]TKH45101.1 dithiol-disulfide isomerase [Paenibacillus terrae]
MSDKNMMCDLQTGICGEVEEDVQLVDFNTPAKKITLYYATDPICSHCWALEPVLNRFVLQYGQYFNIQTIMGGLLQSWHGFADQANGIQKPADVAHHWREVGEHSRMPIDGSLWTTNPIQSSYPPSRVFKVVQRKHPVHAELLLRKLREAVFVFNHNIAEEQVLKDIVNQIGLDGATLVAEAGEDAAQGWLEEDFALAASLGVRGFPTIIMVNEEKQGVKIVGARSLQTYVEALQKIVGGPLTAAEVPKLTNIHNGKQHLFAREIEVMYDLVPQDVETFLANNLPQGTYEVKRIFNELYI